MILNFNKPKKVHSTEEHNEMHTSDSGIAGTYVPNMSKEDNQQFKAKYIKGDDERVEIRVGQNGVNILIKVFKQQRQTPYDPHNWRGRQNDHFDIQMSMNGKLDVTKEEWNEITGAILEAQLLLKGEYKIEDFM